MNELINETVKLIKWLCTGFGANRPLARLIRVLGDLPDNRDSIPHSLKFHTAKGCCPICGDSLYNEISEVVICKDCYAPHHKLCFEWNGKCAQYACGSVGTFNGQLVEQCTGHLRSNTLQCAHNGK